MFEKKKYYNQTMIMLILNFYHVEVWPSELGNKKKDVTGICMTLIVKFVTPNIKECLKEK